MKKAVNRKGETVRQDKSTTEAFVPTVVINQVISHVTLFILSAELFKF